LEESCGHASDGGWGRGYDAAENFESGCGGHVADGLRGDVRGHASAAESLMTAAVMPPMACAAVSTLRR